MFLRRTFLICFLLLYHFVNAQTERCGTQVYLEQWLAENPQLRKTYEHQQAAAASRIENSTAMTATITIPVVFHVVYNIAEQNIPDDRILEQLDVLNNDYNRLNQDGQSTPSPFLGVSAATNIQFCLAKRDPNNKPTSGIIRKQTTVQSFSTGDEVKKTATGGSKGWSKSKYLNIWICNLTRNLLGYATMPGTANDTLDGVVVSYSTIGGPDHVGVHPTYNLGRTLTHEVGHWLNLIHIWGDDGGTCTGTDNVADTPNQASEHFGTPNFPIISCSNNPDGDMFMNFLDYTDDYVMNIFTAGQSLRMQDAVNNSRASLLTSRGCIDTTTAIDVALQNVINIETIYCQGIITPSAVIKNKGTATINSLTFSVKIDDNVAVNKAWTGSLVAGATTTVALDPLTVPAGTHYLNVSVTQSGDGNVSNNISVKRITVTGATALPYSQDFETKRFPADNWLVLNEDNDATFMRSRLASINGSSSLWFYAPLQIPAGSKDIVQLEPFDLTTLAEPVLAFDVACLHDNSISTTASLKILASTDCGSTFSQIFEKTGTALTTAEGSASDVFVPVAEQWRKDSVNLKALNSFNNVILRFEYTSGNANALFIDNLQIDRLGVIYPDASNVNVSVYGQSTYGMLDFSVLLLKTVDFNIDIFDVAGRRVFSKSYSGSAVSDRLSLHQLNAGVYFFRVTSGNDSKSVKIFFR